MFNQEEKEAQQKVIVWGKWITGAVILFVLIIWPISCTIGLLGGIANEALDVAQEELGPRALLTKYEELKSMHANLEARQANVDVMMDKIVRLEGAYEGVPRNEWARVDLTDYNRWQSEVDGTILSFNNLAASYNERMAEVHWAFCNIGDLPAGAEEPLPREWVGYMYDRPLEQ